MRGRASSRNSSRNVSTPNMAITLAKKMTRLPMISSGTQDELHLTNNVNSGLYVGVCSQQGKRPYQEDEYSIRQFLNSNSVAEGNNVETHFFGLFDGHAGGRCSNHIASALPNILSEDVAFFTNLPQALKRSFHNTNEQFLKIAEKMKYHDGSTGICAVVRDTKVLVANVGDCRALIISGGRPIQMSIDQKPTNPEEQKRIAALGGTVVYCMGVARVNRVLAVSRAFGNRTLRTVIRPDAEMMQRELTKNDDYLVIASDGVWDVLKNKDVSDLCYSPFSQNNPQAIADEIVQTALIRGSMDNCTCMVVRLTEYVQRIMASNINSSSTDNINSNKSNISNANNLLGISQMKGSSSTTTYEKEIGYDRTNNNKAGSNTYAGILQRGNLENLTTNGHNMKNLNARLVNNSISHINSNMINYSTLQNSYSGNEIQNSHILQSKNGISSNSNNNYQTNNQINRLELNNNPNEKHGSLSDHHSIIEQGSVSNYDQDDEQTIVPLSNSQDDKHSSSWMDSFSYKNSSNNNVNNSNNISNNSHSNNKFSGGFSLSQSSSSIPYASRRPNTVSGMFSASLGLRPTSQALAINPSLAHNRTSVTNNLIVTGYNQHDTTSRANQFSDLKPLTKGPMSISSTWTEKPNLAAYDSSNHDIVESMRTLTASGIRKL